MRYFHSIFSYLFSILLVLIAIGCNQESSKEISDLAESAKSLVEKVSDELPAHTDLSKLSSEQAEKILAMEYKIIDYTTPPSGAEIENKLNALGQNRWECLVSSAVNAPVRIQCRRPAKVFLRYALSRLF